MFQFLIGTVKTLWKVIEYNSITKFQFLIGTVKTLPKSTASTAAQGFQFLIGTVKTCFRTEQHKKRRRVSIPHRYCKNSV